MRSPAYGSTIIQVGDADTGFELCFEAAFNRAFKRRFALPPARYRREARAAVAAKIPPVASARRMDARA